jgi:hypothetical protein
MKAAVIFAAVAACIASPAQVLAAESAPYDFRVLCGLGAGAGAPSSLVFRSEVDAFVRRGMFGAGILLDGHAALFSYTGWSLDAGAGLSIADSGLRFDLLATLGAHVGTFGGGLFDSGFDATLPEVGLRAGISHDFAPAAQSHFNLGLWGVLRTDVGSASGLVTGQSWEDGSRWSTPTTAQSSMAVVMITFGWTGDWTGPAPSVDREEEAEPPPLERRLSPRDR